MRAGLTIERGIAGPVGVGVPGGTTAIPITRTDRSIRFDNTKPAVGFHLRGETLDMAEFEGVRPRDSLPFGHMDGVTSRGRAR